MNLAIFDDCCSTGHSLPVPAADKAIFIHVGLTEAALVGASLGHAAHLSANLLHDRHVLLQVVLTAQGGLGYGGAACLHVFRDGIGSWLRRQRVEVGC